MSEKHVSETRLKSAVLAVQSGRLEEARRLLVSILRQDPGNAAAWVWLGKAVDDPEKRRECFSRALRADPNDEEARRGLVALLSGPQAYVYLQFWSLSMLNSLLSWLEAGIGFAGRWESDALYSVVTLLDAYASAYGRDRFLTAIRHGGIAQTNGRMGNLVFDRIRGKGPVPPGWADREGRIKVWDSYQDRRYTPQSSFTTPVEGWSLFPLVPVLWSGGPAVLSVLPMR